jgi:hypothetical protein
LGAAVGVVAANGRRSQSDSEASFTSSKLFQNTGELRRRFTSDARPP